MCELKRERKTKTKARKSRLFYVDSPKFHIEHCVYYVYKLVLEQRHLFKYLHTSIEQSTATYSIFSSQRCKINYKCDRDIETHYLLSTVRDNDIIIEVIDRDNLK